MILVTCTISTFTVARAATRIALANTTAKPVEDTVEHRILVPVASEKDMTALVELVVLMSRPKHLEKHFALHVVDERNSGTDDIGRKLLEQAVKTAAATDTRLEPLVRHDINVASGIAFTVKEYGITDVLLGIGDHATDHFYGPQAEALINRTNRTIVLYHPVQPLGTVTRIVVVVPPKAEFEIGFIRWFDRVKLLARQTGALVKFQGLPNTLERLQAMSFQGDEPIKAVFEPLDPRNDLLLVGKSMKENDLLVLVTARRNSVSYDPLFEKLPRLLSRYFKNNSFIIIYPEQLGDEFLERTKLDPSMGEVLEEGVKTLDNAGRFVRKIFTGNK
jgi:hypothetical protein